jgi:hypothetical protein
MKTSFLKNALIIPVAALSLTGLALAQDDDADTGQARPMFVTLPPKPGTGLQPAVALPTWNGSFTYKAHTYNYNMVGTAPSTNTSTTIQVYIIPIKVVITRLGKKTTFDPSHVLTNGRTVIQNTVDSPIFDSTTTYVQGAVDVGTTQYIDAFQRANFWGTVSSNTSYHLMLGGPTVLAEQTLSPPAADGKTASPFGFKAGLVNINWFDAQLQTIMKSFSQIQPNTLPIFLTYDVYLTGGAPKLANCCIGGYHSATGAQAYSHATYVDVVGQFAQDVSALSHEVGEWADDPLVNNTGNPVACGLGAILEVGDPLEGNPNFGGYGYTVNGFKYNLQDLVTLPYFGAPTSTSVNGWLTFQGESLSVCQNGG